MSTLIQGPRGGASTRWLVGLALLAAILAGCGTPAPSPTSQPAAPTAAKSTPQPTAPPTPVATVARSTAAPATPRALEKITVGVPAQSLNFLPLYVGREKGVFAQEGIDLQITVMKAEVASAGLLSGSLDYSAASSVALRAAVTGAPLRAIGFMTVKPTFYIISKPEIRTMEGLRGKIIATTSVGGSTTAALQKALRQAGMDPSRDVQVLTTGNTSNAYTTLVSGQADAAVLSVPYNVQAEKEGYYPLLYAGDVTSSPESGLAVSTAKLKENPDQVKRMLRGILNSLKYLREHRAETTVIITRDFEVDQSLADKAYDTMIRSYSKDGSIDDSAVEEVIDTQRADAGITQKFSVGDVTDFSLLRQAQRELGL